jgi:hypothetical protein
MCISILLVIVSQAREEVGTAVVQCVIEKHSLVKRAGPAGC